MPTHRDHVLAAAAAIAMAGWLGPALSAQATLQFFTGGEPKEQSGTTLAAAGDIDADGWCDLVVGGPTLGPGVARVVSARTGAVLLELHGDAPGDAFGAAVCGDGDVDGDGAPDVAVGAMRYAPSTEPGYARVVSGATGGVVSTFDGLMTGDSFGHAVVLLDANADGRADVAVGAPMHDVTPGGDEGRVVIFSGLDGSVLHEWLGTAATAGLGYALAPTADMDGDGLPELLAGAPRALVAGQPVGAAVILPGSGGPPLAVFPGSGQSSLFGGAIAACGDLDGDGVADLVVGAQQLFAGPGYVRVLSGASGATIFAFSGTTVLETFGVAVGAADVNGDGFDDVVVGSSRLDVAGVGVDAGAVRVYSGHTGLVLASKAGVRANDRFGTSVTGLPDVDGDGLRDFAAGAPGSAFDPLGTGGYVRVMAALPDPWTLLEGSVAGRGGTPALSGLGSLAAGGLASLLVQHGKPGGAAVLVVGLSELGVPFKGGVLVPHPDLLLAGLALDAEGSLALPFTWPAGVPSGVTTWFQSWIPDGTLPAGFQASNGMSGTTP